MRKNNQEDPLNVFILLTPLHALIAGRIIETYNIQKYYLYVFKEGSTKITHYREKITTDPKKYIELNLSRNFSALSLILSLVKSTRALSSNKRISIFCGSLKSFYSRFICLLFSKRNLTLNTFDDGFANICEDGHLHQNDKYLKELFFFCAGKDYSYASAKSKILNHYTIYRQPNVYGEFAKNLIYINLLKPAPQKPRALLEPSISLLLTAPFYEHKLLGRKDEIELYERAINKFGIKYRLPHPSESAEKSQFINASTIETPLIAEDYIIHLISLYHEVRLFSFGSSAIFNLCALDGVKCVWIRSQNLPHNSMPLEFEQFIEQKDLIS